MASSTDHSNYVEDFLPPSIVEKLEAGAFQSLCTHLRERSDQVQNIDLMTISGFCRNCLAKWLVVEARKLSDALKEEGNNVNQDLDSILQSLDAMGYDEAAQHVYGMHYGDWKKRHSKKASDEQMKLFNDSKPVWAKHDKTILAKRAETPALKETTTAITCPPGGSTEPASSLLSNVCCQDVESDATVAPVNTPKPPSKKARQLPPFQAPLPPSVSFSFGVLTVSDRAFSGEYKTGDLSGPAVQDAVKTALEIYLAQGATVQVVQSEKAIVPDESNAIQLKLKEWSDDLKLDLILTTGGTGFSSRDVTPEATNVVIDKSCDGLITFCTMECSKLQPLSTLSRGTAGIRGKTLIANLPGNPQGAQEIIPVLFPLALHAIADMKVL